jgi:N-acetyl-anhydromuramyl-L-alanine amidase AmpD
MFQTLLKLILDALGTKGTPKAHKKKYVEALKKEPAEKTPEEHGLKEIVPVLKLGDSGPKVKSFQENLERLGYELTRFGADGHFGDESLVEVTDFQDDDRDNGGTLKAEEHALKLQGVGPKTYAAIVAAAKKIVTPLPVPDKDPDEDSSDGRPPNFFKLCPEDGKGVKAKRKRKWKDIKGITLHQTASQLGNKPTRYKKVSAHIGITQDGKIIQMNGLDWLVWHAQAFSSRDVGIECDGYFAGIEGNLKTFWRPKSKPDRMPMTVSKEQIKATLDVIEWIMKEVEWHGGEVEYIHAHRQSSMSRTSDPGSKVWQEVAMVAKKRWGLKDGGPKFSVGGTPVPREWDPSYTASYRG